MKKKIGLVGAGKRQRSFYIPVIKKMEEMFSICGIVNRTESTGRDLSQEIGCNFYKDIESLIKAESPDMLVVAIKHDAIVQVIESFPETKVPILIETPVEDQNIIRLEQEKGLVISVAEQWPYLPLEQFKEQLYEKEILERPMLVMNDGRSFDYHAIAQMRSYIGRDSYPVIATGNIAGTNNMIFFKDNDGKEMSSSDIWEIGSVTFSNGSVLNHSFSYMCKKAPFRTIQSLRGYSKSGTVLTGKINDKSNDYEILDFRVLTRSGDSVMLDIKVDRSDGITRSISENTYGTIWKNEFHKFELDDQETAIATHISYISRNQKPLYSVRDSLIDSITINGLKRACHTRETLRFS